jgi:hypothetical protein
VTTPTQLTFSEATILLVKELTVSEITRYDNDTHRQETGSRRVRHVGAGPSVEEARRMNEVIRRWGPMIAATLRGDWIRDSRGAPVLAKLAVSATGAVHFTKAVEPHVLDALIRILMMIDGAPVLTMAADALIADAWVVLTQDPRNASLPPRDAYVRDAIAVLERFVTPLVRGSATTAPYPKRVQAAANLLFCATVAAILRARRGRLPTLPSRSRRATTIIKDIGPVVRSLFSAKIAPATGAVPTPTEVEAALLYVEAHFDQHGTDFPQLFAALATALV